MIGMGLSTSNKPHISRQHERPILDTATTFEFSILFWRGLCQGIHAIHEI